MNSRVEYSNVVESRASILNLQIPFTEEDLKQSFRLKAKETHPDRGGDAETFKSVFDAYEFLQGFISIKSSGYVKGVRTFEGQIMSDLGQGLGPTTNGKTCDKCDGRGYTMTINRILVSGEECAACGGSGLFYKSKSHMYYGWPVRCGRCQGRGNFNAVYEERNIYHTCTHCSGTGEVEIHNPVLQKGGMQILQSKKTKFNNKKHKCVCGAVLRNGKCWRCN